MHARMDVSGLRIEEKSAVLREHFLSVVEPEGLRPRVSKEKDQLDAFTLVARWNHEILNSTKLIRLVFCDLCSHVTLSHSYFR